MKFEVQKGYVKHRGVLHGKGSFFDADADEVQSLIAKSVLLKVEDVPAKDPAAENQTDNTDPDFVLPAIDDFAKMKAEEQKALLVEVGVDPASNAEERLKQYTEFYESVDVDNEDV